MATIMMMHWPEVSKEQYEEVRTLVNWEGDAPKGGKFHVAWFGDDGLHVLDLWESAGEFNDFAQNRLMPSVQAVGIQGQPQVSFAESHAVFAPNP